MAKITDSAPVHYTAVIEVTKTTEPHQPKNDRGYPEGQVTSREVDQVSKFVIRADNLETLKNRITAHTALIEE